MNLFKVKNEVRKSFVGQEMVAVPGPDIRSIKVLEGCQEEAPATLSLWLSLKVKRAGSR